VCIRTHRTQYTTDTPSVQTRAHTSVYRIFLPLCGRTTRPPWLAHPRANTPMLLAKRLGLEPSRRHGLRAVIDFFLVENYTQYCSRSAPRASVINAISGTHVVMHTGIPSPSSFRDFLISRCQHSHPLPLNSTARFRSFQSFTQSRFARDFTRTRTSRRTMLFDNIIVVGFPFFIFTIHIGMYN
jgi:hypothetical protein